MKNLNTETRNYLNELWFAPLLPFGIEFTSYRLEEAEDSSKHIIHAPIRGISSNWVPYLEQLIENNWDSLDDEPTYSVENDILTIVIPFSH